MNLIFITPTRAVAEYASRAVLKLHGAEFVRATFIMHPFDQFRLAGLRPDEVQVYEIRSHREFLRFDAGCKMKYVEAREAALIQCELRKIKVQVISIP